MGHQSERRTGKSNDSDAAYRHVIEHHRKHGLVRLKGLVDWETMSKRLLSLGQEEVVLSDSSCEPQVLLKMLFLSYLYGLSDRSTHELVQLNLLPKWFVGLAVDEPAPEEATLSEFRRQLDRVMVEHGLEAMFEQVLQTARRHGLAFGNVSVSWPVQRGDGRSGEAL